MILADNIEVVVIATDTEVGFTLATAWEDCLIGETDLGFICIPTFCCESL